MSKRHLTGLVSVMALSLFAASCGKSEPPVTKTSATDAEWALPGGTTDESGFSSLTQINADNVSKLGLDWYFDLPGEVSLEATPLAVDGILYFTGSYSKVYAVDGKTGELVWEFDPKIWEYNPKKQGYALPVNRGAAYANGKIFFGAIDGRLFALDAKTGEKVWMADTVPPNSFHTITGAPRILNDLVIIGNGGADAGARGFVTAYNQETGEEVWKFYTVPGSPEENAGNPAMERASETWTGDAYYTGGGSGGTVWNGMTYDPELNQVYIGVGNAGPYNPRARSPEGGDNLYIASIVALDAETGEYKWHYQQNPKEAWDYKSTANMISAELEIDGELRKVLMQIPTNGFFYVLDRETGELISAEKVGKVTWAEKIDLETGRPVEAENIRYETGDTIMWPSMIGAHNWQPMSFNPDTGLVYIPYQKMAAHYTTNLRPGEFSFAGMTVHPYLTDETDGTGAVVAWDPIKQEEAWKAPIETIWNGGTLTTAGNLVFQGAGDGYVSAYNATTGEQLFHFNAGLGIVGAPITYEIDGKQYVSILVGYGGTTSALSSVLNAGWKYGAQERRLLTFSLDGKETLPPMEPRDMTVYPVDDPELALDPQDVKAGQFISVQCIACHGMNLVSAGAPAPDLRESNIALSFDALKAVLHDGLLKERGMPVFPDMTDTQIRQLQAYIRKRARDAMEDGGASDRLTPQGDPAAYIERFKAELAGPAYSTSKTTIGDMLDKPEIRALLDEYLPGMSTDPRTQQARGMTLEQVQAFAPDAIPPEVIEKLDAELAKIKGPAKPEGAASGPEPKYSVDKTSMGTLLKDPEAKALVDKYFPGVSSDPRIGLAKSMTLRQIQGFAADKFPDDKMDALDADLAKLGSE